jgi:hypothetical protein
MTENVKQAIRTLSLIDELSSKNSPEDYRDAVQAIKEIAIDQLIDGPESSDGRD